MNNADLIKTFKTWEVSAEKRWKPIFADMKTDQMIYDNDIAQIHKKKAKHQSKISIPAAFRTIQTMLAIIKDFLPTTDIMPTGDKSDEFADLMKLRIDHEFEQMKFNALTLDTSEDMLRFMNGASKITWDSKRNRAVGELLNPYAVLFDEQCTSVESAAYIRIRYPMRISDIKRLKKFDAKPDAQMKDGIFEPFDDKTVTAGDGSVETVSSGNVPSSTANPYTGGSNETVSFGGTQTMGDGYAFLDEWWYTDPLTGEEMYAEVINGQILGEPSLNTVVSPGGYGRKPIIIAKNYGSKHYLYGTSEEHVTKSIDLAMNETANSTLDWIRKAANPPRYYLRSMLQGLGAKFFGRDNEEVVMNRPDEAGFMKLPPAPLVADSFTKYLSLVHDAMSGVPDVTTGRNPAGVTSGTAIAELQEAGQTNIRYKIDNEITDFVVECGWFMIFLILKFDAGSMVLNRGEGANAETVQWDAAIFRKDLGFELEKINDWRDTPFNIRVVGGQQAPKTRAEMLARADVLFDKGIYGVEDMVRDLELPDSKSIIQRYYERQGWSPEAVTQLVEGLAQQMARNPDDPTVLAQLDIMQQVFPSYVEEAMGQMPQ